MASASLVRIRLAAAALVALLAPAASAAAQQTTPAPQPETGPKVGEVAPNFSLPGATRYGLLRDPVQLSDLRGKTVVLAFFIKARTRG
jgi:peroxiredoxin Q/BCP